MNPNLERIILECEMDKSEKFKNHKEAMNKLLTGNTMLLDLVINNAPIDEIQKQIVENCSNHVKYLEFLDEVKK